MTAAALVKRNMWGSRSKQSLGSMHPGPLFRTLLTVVLTGRTVMGSGGNGMSGISSRAS